MMQQLPAKAPEQASEKQSSAKKRPSYIKPTLKKWKLKHGELFRRIPAR